MLARCSKPIVTLFTKADCYLCDVVKAVMARSAAPEHKLVEVDITAPENKAWFQRYRYDIPVLHLNGRFLAKHRLDKTGFEQAIADEAAGRFQPPAGDPNPEIDAGPTPME